jgi:RNA recognition motif-containing protein
MSAKKDDVSFKGTSFESMENKILNDLNKKRKRDMGGDGSNDGQRDHKASKPKKQMNRLDPAVKSQIKAFNKSKIVPSSSSSSASKTKSVAPKKDTKPVRTEPENSFNNDRTVYIQGIPFTCTEVEVTSFFKGCGDILNVRLPKWHDSGNLKGYGHIEFKTESSAEKALELSGQYLKDRYVMVERPMTPKVMQSKPTDAPNSTAAPVIRPPGCRTIFIKNLPYEVTEAELIEAFRVYGPIASIRLAEWGHTKNLKGFGYVEFKREDSAEIAVKKSGTLLIKERPITCDFETGKPKGSFKDNKNIVAGKAKTKGFTGVTKK